METVFDPVCIYFEQVQQGHELLSVQTVSIIPARQVLPKTTRDDQFRKIVYQAKPQLVVSPLRTPNPCWPRVTISWVVHVSRSERLEYCKVQYRRCHNRSLFNDIFSRLTIWAVGGLGEIKLL